MFRLSRGRLLTHLAMAVMSTLGCVVTVAVKPAFTPAHVVALGLAYVSLIQLALTLLVGPWQLLAKKRRTPVNIDLRRDIGIWAALTGTAHVILGFQLHMEGRILHFFFAKNRLRPLINLFGFSNYVGLAATALLLVLLMISNDVSLRWLRARTWKLIQRFNYALFPLVLLHTVGYQFLINRERIMVVLTLGLAFAVLIYQVRGFGLYRARRSAFADTGERDQRGDLTGRD